jgi:hypothetical protein
MNPDPTPDPTPFFGDFKDAKNSFHIFSYNLKAHYLQSEKFIFWLKFCVKFYFASVISVRSTSL